MVRVKFHNFAHISAVLRPILTKCWPKWWHHCRQKKNLIIWPGKCRPGSQFAKITISQQLYDRFLPNFHRNDVTMASNNSVIAFDLENVDKGRHLQNHNISAIIQPNLTKLSLTCYWGWQQKHHISLPLKYRSNSHFLKSIILGAIKPIWTKFSSRMMTPIPKLSRLYV